MTTQAAFHDDGERLASLYALLRIGWFSVSARCGNACRLSNKNVIMCFFVFNYLKLSASACLL